MNSRPNPTNCRGEAAPVIVLVLGCLAIFLVLTSLDLSRKKPSNESMAAGSLRYTIAAIADYEKKCGRLPDTLSQLGPGSPPSCEAGAGLLQEQLSRGVTDGYHIAYRKLDKDHFIAIAAPDDPGGSGRRYFFCDQTYVIRNEVMKPATAQSPTLF